MGVEKPGADKDTRGRPSKRAGFRAPKPAISTEVARAPRARQLSHETRFTPIDHAIVVRLSQLCNLRPWRFNDAVLQATSDRVHGDFAGAKVELGELASWAEAAGQYVESRLADATTIARDWRELMFTGEAPMLGPDSYAALASLRLDISWFRMGGMGSKRNLRGVPVVYVDFSEDSGVTVHPKGGVRARTDDLDVKIMTAKAAECDTDDQWETKEGRAVVVKLRPFKFQLESPSDIGWDLTDLDPRINDVLVQGHVELNDSGLEAEARVAALVLKGIGICPRNPFSVNLFDEHMCQDVVVVVTPLKDGAPLPRWGDRSFLRTRVRLPGVEN